MNYEKLSKLDDDRLIEGMNTYYLNAKNLLNTGIELAKNYNYGLAVSLIVLSIEELIKGFAVFQVYMGETRSEIVDPAFKSNNIHQTRLILASGYNFVFSLINEDTIKTLVTNSFSENLKNFKFEDPNDLNKIIETIISSITSDKTLIPDNIENEINKEIKNTSNWYYQAKTKKERGMYVDYLNNKWHLPKSIKKEDYEEALSYANETFEKVGNPIKEIINGEIFKREIIRKFFKKVKPLLSN
jgi:AbiV family abortive infection protein